MKRLTVRLYVYVFAPLRRYASPLALLLLLTVAVAQPANPFDNNLFGYFSDPVAFTSIVTAVSTWLTGILVDARKDADPNLRGNRTKLYAALVATLIAGVGGYFGLSYFAPETSGWNGVIYAGVSAFVSWFLADQKHKAAILQRTGMRKAVRENEIVPGLPVEEVEEVVDPILTNLLKEAAKLPPPFGIAASIVTTVYETFGAAAVLKLIRTQRALSEAEKSEDQDAWEREQAGNPTVRQARPNPPPAPNPSPSE